MLAFLLVSCGNNAADTSNNNIAGNNAVDNGISAQDLSKFKMTVYEVESHPTGMPMETYVVEKEEYDPFQAWQEKKKQKEEWDEYNWKKKKWDKEKKDKEDGKYWSEEARIKAYCKENGYLKCIKITETELKDGVHEVKITCEDSDFNPKDLVWDEFDPDEECKDYDVVVE